jgi:two-component system, chemotaxis family, response regulator Rcp1
MTLCDHNASETITILLVEDNPGDVELTRLAFEESKLLINLSVAGDGVAAMSFLQQRKQAKSAQPDLVLLDLNLPKKNGRELLAELKADKDLKRIPVIILTTSQAEEDVLGAYNSYASGYITKPVSFEQFIKVVQSIEQFWFTIVKLPSR